MTKKEMKKSKMPLDEVAWVVNNEGLSYAITSYLGRDVYSESDELNEAWAEAHDSLEKVMSLLPEECYDES